MDNLLLPSLTILSEGPEFRKRQWYFLSHLLQDSFQGMTVKQRTLKRGFVQSHGVPAIGAEEVTPPA